jgi:uncharacterized membrane protein
MQMSDSPVSAPPRATRQVCFSRHVLLAAGTGVMNGILLASAVVPVVIVLVLAWFFLRAGRRHDEHERQERAAERP